MKTVEEEWQVFSGMVLPKDASPVQASEMKLAYFAGCYTILCALERIGEPEAQSFEALKRM